MAHGNKTKLYKYMEIVQLTNSG